MNDIQRKYVFAREVYKQINAPQCQHRIDAVTGAECNAYEDEADGL